MDITPRDFRSGAEPISQPEQPSQPEATPEVAGSSREKETEVLQPVEQIVPAPDMATIQDPQNPTAVPDQQETTASAPDVAPLSDFYAAPAAPGALRALEGSVGQ